MKRAFVPLFLFLLVLIGFIYRGFTANSIEEPDSTQKADGANLLEWYNDHKVRSRNLREADNPGKAIAVLDSCLKYAHRKPKTEEEFDKCGWIYVNRAYLYEAYQGNFLLAKNDYLKALQQFKSTQSENSFLLARYVYQPLGNIHTRFGENEQAIRLLERFIAVSYENDQIDAALNGTNDLGRALMNKGDYHKAQSVLKEGITKCEQDFYNKGLLLSSLAEVHANDNQIDAGIEASRASLLSFDLARKSIDKNDFRFGQLPRYEIGTETVLGTLLTKKKAYAESMAIMKDALDKAKLIYPEKHRKLAKIHIAIGQNFSKQGNYQSAANSYHKALLSVISDFDNIEILSSPSFQILNPEVSIGEALIGKAQALTKLAGPIQNSRAALTSYLAYFEWVRINALEQQDLYSKLFFADEVHTNAELALKFLINSKDLLPEDSAAKVAFSIIDQSKGMILSESISSLKLSRIKKDKRFNKLRNISAQIAQFRRALKAENEQGKIDELKRSLSELDQLQQGILSSLKREYSGLTREIYSYDKETLFASLKGMNSRNAVLNYFLGDSMGICIGVVENKYSIHEFNTSVYDSISQLCKELRSPSGMKSSDYSELSINVYNEIIPKELRRKMPSEFMIIPDGILHKLPFEALVTKPKKSPSWKNLSYLVHSSSVTYAHSAISLFSKKPDANETSFAGIAPGFSNSKTLPELPESIPEIEHGAKVLGGETFTESEATKDQFLNLLRDNSIVHVSSHAGTQKGMIEDNWIAFYSGKKKDRLLNSELLQLNLDNELVVLNACETGSGKYYAGEGSMSLARGFLASGSHRVITNLWLANHTSNSQIFRSFYKNLSTNPNASLALKNAKIEFISSETTDNVSAHPHYWATPIIIGSSESITINTSNPPFSIYWFGLILLCSLAVLIYFRFKIAKFIRS